MAVIWVPNPGKAPVKEKKNQRKRLRNGLGLDQKQKANLI